MVGRTRVGRVAAFTALWRVVRGAQRPGGPSLGERVRALPRMLAAAVSGRYPLLGAGRVGMLVLAALYLVSPLDVVPELLLPVIGLGDDAVVLAWLAGTLLAEADRFVAWEQGAEDGEVPPGPTPRTVPGGVV